VADSADVELDDELRRQRFELRLVQEEAELEGELASRRAMSLDEVLVQWLVVGDVVEIATIAGSVAGVVVGHSSDVATVEVDSGRLAEVALAHLVAARSVSHSHAGTTAETTGRTMRVVLSDAEVHGYQVTVHVAGRRAPFEGTVRVTGREHVELIDAQAREWLVPLPTIAMVLRPESPSDAWVDG
jgi:hypothetical protein